MISSASISTVAESGTPEDRNAIDKSLRFPVLLFFGSATFWLLVGGFLGLIAAWKLVFPGFLDCAAWLGYGRIRPAAVNSLIYGWASLAGIGAALWFTARLCRAKLRHSKLLVASAILWNLGVLLGVLGIIAGYSRSIDKLEFPGFASAVLLVAYAFMAIWVLILFRDRRPGEVYAAQWYILGAFLWFPWAYATANLFLIWHPVSGAAQGPIIAWFSSSVLDLWLAPLALAGIFYLVPKILGRPIFSRTLNVLAFWSFALFASWKGTAQLIGGPIPAWMVSAGVVAAILMIIPAWIIMFNITRTMAGCSEALNWSPALRFAITGLGGFLIAVFGGALTAMPWVNSVVNFTEWVNGMFLFQVLGFVSMALFAAIYFIVPRLVAWEWPSINLIRWHYWLAFCGVGLGGLSLLIGGLVQGYALNDPGVNFGSSVNFVAPFRFLGGVCEIAFFASCIFFAVLLNQMLLKYGMKKDTPTLFDKPRELEVTAV